MANFNLKSYRQIRSLPQLLPRYNASTAGQAEMSPSLGQLCHLQNSDPKEVFAAPLSQRHWTLGPA